MDGVNLIEMVPSSLKSYLKSLETGKGSIGLPELKYVLLVGEKITPQLVNEFYSCYKIQIINVYGQTECSGTNFHCTVPYDTDTVIVPIGKPSNNTYAYVLDSSCNVQPIGAVGELYVSGDSVAMGYLNRPELNTERFLPNPFIEGERMYRSGDLVKWLPDGNLEYLGRTDHQVKIRGFRVELGEIEAVMAKYKKVKEAVVILKNGKDDVKYLCAYIVPDNRLDIGELKQWLARELPEYMVPSYYVQLESLPLTPNGKMDRNSLPEPKFTLDEQGTEKESEDESQAGLYEIVWRLKEIIIENVSIQLEAKDIFPEKALDFYGVDSIAYTNILMCVETEYGFLFEEKDMHLKRFKDIKAFGEYICQRAE